MHTPVDRTAVADTAADLPELHRPWTAALEIGLISIDGGKARPGPAVASWPDLTEEEMLDGWSRLLVTVLAGTFNDDSPATAWHLGRIALATLSTEPAPAGDDLLETIEHTAAHASEETFELVVGGFGARHPAAMALEVLATFGAITGDEQPAITSLGRWALTEISNRGSALPDGSPDESVPDPDAVYQLAITLTRIRPPCWRRILVPSAATLGDLHEIIHIALEWNDDHLHLFTIGTRQLGDPDFDADGDENEMRLGDAFRRSATLSYVYDLGDHWQHEITLEATRHATRRRPTPAAPAGGETARSRTGSATDPTPPPSTRQRSTTDSAA